MVEMLEAEVGELKEDVQTAKTWAKASMYFVGVFAGLAGVLKKIGII
jgi:hypothetical protein